MNNNNNKPDPESLYQLYRERQVSEDTLDQVMNMIASDQTNKAPQATATDESSQEALLRLTYQQYVNSRSTHSEQDVESVMSLIEADLAEAVTAADQVTAKREASTSKDGSESALTRLFTLPSRVIDGGLNWVASALRPRVVVPAMAVALAVVAVSPLIFNQFSKTGTGNSDSVAFYEMPETLLISSDNVVAALDTNAEISMSMSASNERHKNLFELGRRLAEVDVLLQQEKVPPVHFNVVSMKLKRLSGSFEQHALSEVLSSIATEIPLLPATRNSIEQALSSLHVVVENNEDLSVQWVAFGKALEALAIATRANGTDGDNSIVHDALNGLAGLEIPEVESANDSLSQILTELNEMTSDNAIGLSVERISRLIQQVLIIV